ncbi:MAG: hypothetical protein WB819_19080, partial [Terriglobia bacterium]
MALTGLVGTAVPNIQFSHIILVDLIPMRIGAKESCKRGTTLKQARLDAVSSEQLLGFRGEVDDPAEV